MTVPNSRRLPIVAAALAIAVCLPTASIAQTSAPAIPMPSAQFTAAQADLDKAWAAEGLGFSVATYATSEAPGYGQYSPRPTSDFAVGEPITIYAEPIGYSFSEDAGGYTYDVEVGFRLLNTTGQVLAEESSFATFSETSRSKRRELGTSLSFQFDGLPAGTYVLNADFNDRIGGKAASVSLPLTIVNAE